MGASRQEKPKRSGNLPQTTLPKQSQDPLADAEKALKELRQHPDNKQAADQLEKAVQWLKQRAKPKDGDGN